MERHLAAILVADVVGYSRLIRADEEGVLAALRTLRADCIAPTIKNHRGRIIKLMGDGMLAEFASTVDAVRAAIEVQQAVTRRNARLPDDKRIEFRIGINVGDVIVDGGDIYGDGVNVAARLEGLAAHGGICVSGAVHDQVIHSVKVPFEDMGDRQVKNIDQPVRVWRWPATAAGPKTAAPRDQGATPIVLVEEFSHSGPTDASAELAEELRGEILDALAHRTGVRVAVPADGGETPAYVLRGRCRVAGDRCRLHLWLTIAANGETFWSKKIDREIVDLFGFLDDVVANISAALRTHINAYAGAAYASAPDDALDLQQLLSKAAFFFYHHDADSIAISRRTMDAAVARAPEHPMALAMQAYAIIQAIPLAIERVEDVDADAALSFADRSVYYGPNVDFAFRNRGRVRLWLRRDHEGCRADAKRALSINPLYHVANEELSLADLFGGRPARGADRLEDMLRDADVEPWHTPYRQSMLGLAHALAGDGPSAIEYARAGYERRPLIPIHALAYAIAASWDASLVRSTEVRAMIDRHGLKVSDADRFPFALASDAAAVADRLRRSGAPE